MIHEITLEQLIDYFGTTHRDSDAGFVNQEGVVLDLRRHKSGANIKHLALVPAATGSCSGGEEAMFSIMDHLGLMRCDVLTGHYHVTREPSLPQIKFIFKNAKYRSNPIRFYLTDKRGNVEKEYELRPTSLHNLMATLHVKL
jgi:hypothetical protein